MSLCRQRNSLSPIAVGKQEKRTFVGHNIRLLGADVEKQEYELNRKEEYGNSRIGCGMNLSGSGRLFCVARKAAGIGNEE